MDKGKKFGPIMLHIKGITITVKNQVLGNLIGQMGHAMKEILKITILMVKENIHGQMAENIMGCGKIIKWRVKEYLFGLMKGSNNYIIIYIIFIYF